VLLDEVEKAHPDVLGLLLQIMEEGELTDSTGRKVNFKNTIVVMTCNVGAQLKSEGLGFCARGREAEFSDALRQYFTPEFLGRLDATVTFRTLEADAMDLIAGKYLDALTQRAASLGIQLQLPEGLTQHLCSLCRGEDGARYLRRLVQTEVEGPLAAFLLRCARRPSRVHGELKTNGLLFY